MSLVQDQLRALTEEVKELKAAAGSGQHSKSITPNTVLWWTLPKDKLLNPERTAQLLSSSHRRVATCFFHLSCLGLLVQARASLSRDLSQTESKEKAPDEGGLDPIPSTCCLIASSILLRLHQSRWGIRLCPRRRPVVPRQVHNMCCVCS